MSNQVCETCTNPSVCTNCRQDRVIVTTPITRAFDAKNTDGSIRHILIGYGVLLNELDDFGTALSRELVEDSIPLLMKYPAVRYMHKEPFGHIIFDETIDGFQTRLDEKGFFVVVEIGSQFEKEFSLIKSDGWGFSWGMFPTAPSVSKRVGGKIGQVFEKGRVYEISVVDVPAQSNASITVLRGTPQIHHREEGFIAMLEASQHGNDTLTPEEETETNGGFLAMLSASTKGEKIAIERHPLMERSLDFESQLPEICSDDCIIRRHCGAYPSQVGSLCIKNMEQYKNDKFIQK